MIDTLISKIAQLPGVGPKSAKKITLHLLVNKSNVMHGVIKALESVFKLASCCVECGNLDITNPCKICNDETRDRNLVCVVKSVSDLWALENARVYNGNYYVLGNDTNNSSHRIKRLDKLISDKAAMLEEVIIAMGSTLEDQITTHYLKKVLESKKILITALACGIPLGAEIDYIDEGTLTVALQSRKKL